MKKMLGERNNKLGAGAALGGCVLALAAGACESDWTVECTGLDVRQVGARTVEATVAYQTDAFPTGSTFYAKGAHVNFGDGLSVNMDTKNPTPNDSTGEITITHKYVQGGEYDISAQVVAGGRQIQRVGSEVCERPGFPVK